MTHKLDVILHEEICKILDYDVDAVSGRYVCYCENIESWATNITEAEAVQMLSRNTQEFPSKQWALKYVGIWSTLHSFPQDCCRWFHQNGFDYAVKYNKDGVVTLQADFVNQDVNKRFTIDTMPQHTKKSLAFLLLDAYVWRVGYEKGVL